MNEYEQELVKEILGEAKKIREVFDYSFNRLEELAKRLLEKKEEKKEETSEAV